MDYEIIDDETYNGKPMFEIVFKRKSVVKFGLNKAKAIVACIEKIKEFVKKHDK